MKLTVITDIHIGYSPKKLSKFGKFISKLDSDVLLITGDIISHKQKQLNYTFRVLRENNPNIKVLVVKGNHEFWQKDNEFNTLWEMERLHQEVYDKYDIQYLHRNKFEQDNVVIWGFDGWYSKYNVETNDMYNMPLNSGMAELTPVHYMWKREGEAIDYILDDLEKPEYEDKIKIVATHFNLTVENEVYMSYAGNTRLAKILFPKIDYLFYGHTHQKDDRIIDGCRVMNAGADYNKVPHESNGYYINLEL